MLTDAQLDRYARHLILPEVGGAGQQKLLASRVLAVGAGGLGAPLLLYLAAAGVGTLGVIDDDDVDVSNLQRQVIHGNGRIGRPKAESAAAGIHALDPAIRVETHNERLTEANAASLFRDYDLILDGSDNFATRYLVNAAAAAAGRTLVSGAVAALRRAGLDLQAPCRAGASLLPLPLSGAAAAGRRARLLGSRNPGRGRGRRRHAHGGRGAEGADRHRRGPLRPPPAL